MIYKAFSNRLYELQHWTGQVVKRPELLYTLRYKGTSLKRARAAILPLDPGCSGEIRLVQNGRDLLLEKHDSEDTPG